MKARWLLLRGIVTLAVAAGTVAPVGATTLIRAGLEDLATTNDTIVLGEVLDAKSYWNADGTFILTDVQVSVVELLKGRDTHGEITVTLLGGTVGDLTALILGGAELTPGQAYLLFLAEADLPGVQGVRTVRDHSQGVFDIVLRQGDLRAVSQASRFPLVPDAFGNVEPPGGTLGIPFDEMIRSVRELASRTPATGQEVER